MKKYLLVLFLALMGSMVHAQYRTYKNQYDVKNYTYQSTDRYNPKTASILSAFFPGLGYFAINEPFRGVGYIYLTYESLAITSFGAFYNEGYGGSFIPGLIMGTGVSLFVITYVTGITGANKIAKIKNMHFRDQKLAFHFYPSLQDSPVSNTHSNIAPGITLSLNF